MCVFAWLQTKSDLQSLDFVINICFMNLFTTKSIETAKHVIRVLWLIVLWAKRVFESELRAFFHTDLYIYTVFQKSDANSCCSETVRWILLKCASFTSERWQLKPLRGYLILIRYAVVIVIWILASLFWNTVYSIVFPCVYCINLI